MESKKCDVYPMKSGDGVSSYTNNSSYQRSLSDIAMLLINDAIMENLEIENFTHESAFKIADMGCSVGPNTLIAVQNIINSVKLKYQSLTNSKTPVFHVFFNDHASNDFNILFKTLAMEKQPYYAAGVPGSFHGRLFPRGSIHLVHSSFALHWLSQVPKEVREKGRVDYCSSNDDEVMKAYRNQYGIDMDGFLKARGEEVVCGGLVVILVPGRPNGVSHSHCIGNVLFDVLGSCLMEMINQGKIEEDKVECLNIPIYYASPEEVEEAVERNGLFSVEKMEGLPHIPEPETKVAAGRLAMGVRVGVEAVFKGQHFKDDTIDDLFQSFRDKLERKPSLFSSGGASIIYALLKRNNI